MTRRAGCWARATFWSALRLSWPPQRPPALPLQRRLRRAQGKFRTCLTSVAYDKSVRLAELVAAGKDVYKDLSSRVHHGEGGKAPFEAECLQGLPTIEVLALVQWKEAQPSHGKAPLPWLQVARSHAAICAVP